MIKYLGKPVSRGIAVGPVCVLENGDLPVKRLKIKDAEAEISRLEAAREQAKEQLSVLYEKAVEEAGQAGAAIFEVHRIMLDDEDLFGAMREMIRREMVNGEYAAAMTGDYFSEMFAGMEDAYMRARAADVRDVVNRLIANLSGKQVETANPEEPSVLVAEDLSPSETVRLKREQILAFVTVRGSAHSHTAILARMMGIPAVVCAPVEFAGIKNGMTAAVNGFDGTVIFDPTEEELAVVRKKLAGEGEKSQLLKSLKGKENVTADGRKIDIFANIGNVSDVARVLENDAGGIGLFRSEFLYLERETIPSEAEQFHVYRQVLQLMAGKRVIIRTVDLGADKQASYLKLEAEANPALGCRGIRLCLKRPEIFKPQLRALLRAAVYGNLAILYPMITDRTEVEQVLELVQEAAKELEADGVPYRIPEQGIMIETPASAMISDELAELVDFFSIGTNDLAQYALAADRQNESIGELYDPRHRAVLAMIRMAAENAHRFGKRVGICGELASDTDLTEEFLRMGIDELSVAPGMVLKVRKRVREL